MTKNSTPLEGEEGQARGGEAAPARLEGGGGASAVPSPSYASVSQRTGGARASEADADPYPPVTGSALEAADRALLRAENERLRRIEEALSREYLRERGFEDSPTSRNYPWVVRTLKLDWQEVVRHARQVADEFAELRRKQLERKQGQEKED